MRKNTPNKVLLDANVIYSSAIRDILLNLAQANLFEPKWSAKIHEEWTKNLLFKRSDLSKSKVERVVQNMNRAFENANVEDYFDLIPNLQLPDPDDRHVLAAAIKGKAKIITTANLKDFPQDYIRQFGIEVQHPDDFIMELLNEHPEKVLFAFQSQVKSLKNPPLRAEEVLNSLAKSGLEKTVVLLRKMIA